MSGLPEGWALTTLGDCLLTVIGGGTPSRKNPEYFHGDIPWFTVKDMKSLKPNDAEEHISAKAISESATNLIPAHTLIIATRIALGKVIRPTVACAINQDLKALFTGDGVHPYFLLYWILANAREIQEKGSGTTVSGIRLEILNGLSLSLPPAAEQTRIVAKLEELFSDLDAGVAELKAAQKKLGQYRQALLKAGVEGKLTQHWREQHGAPSPQPLSHQGRGAFGVDVVEEAVAKYQLYQKADIATSTPTLSSPAKQSAIHDNSPSTNPPSPLVGEGPGERGREVPTAPETGAQLLERILKQRRAHWEAKQLAKFQAQGKIPPKGWQDKYPEPVKPDTSDLPELPEGWVWCSVDMAGEVQLGRQRAPKYHSGENMVPYLRVANVFENRIDITDVMEMHFSLEEEEIFKLAENDILLNEGQSLELVGRPAIYRNELPRACFTNTLVRFRAELGVDPEYALAVFRHYLHSGVFRKIAKITTNIAHLGAGRFTELKFPLPMYSEQQEIVRILAEQLDQIAEQEVSVQKALKQSAAQRQNILKAAFSGQLVPQNPNDEPASALLERIRAERAAQQTAKAPKKRTSKTIS